MARESLNGLIHRRFTEGADISREFVRVSSDLIEKAAGLIIDGIKGGNKVLVLGNGGSAGDAQHFAAELVGRFGKERRPLPALALTTDTSVLTAVGNDYGFEEIFARQVRAIARRGDVLMAMSTSGRSANVIRAVTVARNLHVATIALTGGDGGDVSRLVDVPIVVPSADAARIQEIHLIVIHILAELIDATLYPNEPTSMDLPKGILQWDDLLRMRDAWRLEGKVVAWTNGCFDVLHVGHLHALRHARQLGDILVVGVNTDDAVRKLKGPSRPVFSLEERLQILAALDVTDYVVAFRGVTPEKALAQLRPDVHVKGEEYAPPSGRPMPEKAVVEGYGGRVAFVPLLQGHSTSDVVERLQQAAESQVASGRPSKSGSPK